MSNTGAGRRPNRTPVQASSLQSCLDKGPAKQECDVWGSLLVKPAMLTRQCNLELVHQLLWLVLSLYPGRGVPFSVACPLAVAWTRLPVTIVKLNQASEQLLLMRGHRNTLHNVYQEIP